MNIRMELLSEADTDAVFRLTSNPEVAKYMRFNTHQLKEEAAELIGHYTESGNYGYKIVAADRRDEAVAADMIGVAAMKCEEEAEGAEGAEGTYSVSIFLSPEYWGKGCSTKAVLELKRIAAAEGIHNLSAYVVEENLGSRRIMEKCGFAVKQILHFNDLDSGLYVYECEIE